MLHLLIEKSQEQYLTQYAGTTEVREYLNMQTGSMDPQTEHKANAVKTFFMYGSLGMCFPCTASFNDVETFLEGILKVECYDATYEMQGKSSDGILLVHKDKTTTPHSLQPAARAELLGNALMGAYFIDGQWITYNVGWTYNEKMLAQLFDMEDSEFLDHIAQLLTSSLHRAEQQQPIVLKEMPYGKQTLSVFARRAGGVELMTCDACGAKLMLFSSTQPTYQFSNADHKFHVELVMRTNGEKCKGSDLMNISLVKIPSGQVAYSDWFQGLDVSFSDVAKVNDRAFDINSPTGRCSYNAAYAEQNIMHGSTGNSSPFIYKMPGGFWIGLNDDGTSIGQIHSNVWTYTLMDKSLLESACAEEGVNVKPEYYYTSETKLFEVEPGEYMQYFGYDMPRMAFIERLPESIREHLISADPLNVIAVFVKQ